jgi:hypothetical protein
LKECDVGEEVDQPDQSYCYDSADDADHHSKQTGNYDPFVSGKIREPICMVRHFMSPSTTTLSLCSTRVYQRLLENTRLSRQFGTYSNAVTAEFPAGLLFVG